VRRYREDKEEAVARMCACVRAGQDGNVPRDGDTADQGLEYTYTRPYTRAHIHAHRIETDATLQTHYSHTTHLFVPWRPTSLSAVRDLLERRPTSPHYRVCASFKAILYSFSCKKFEIENGWLIFPVS